MATYKQLTLQLDKLTKRIEKEREKAMADAIAEIKTLIDQYEITAEELGFQSASPKAKVKVKRSLPPKYKNSQTGETWSGRGRTPKWLAKTNKKNWSRFLIE